MRWSDIGFLVSINSSKENSSIIKIFSNDHGCYSGIVYGSSSKKKKPDLQLGNKVKINYSSKSEDTLGYFSLELIENISIKFFNNPIKLDLMLTSIEIISKVMPERQANQGCYDDFNLFLKNLEMDNLKAYVMWEHSFIKNIGYGPDLEEESNLKDNIKNILLKPNSDFTFNDLKTIFDLNASIINSRLSDIINITSFKYRNKILKYFNE